MKTQMKFQKIMCLIMLIVGALALLSAFFWQTGALASLGETYKPSMATGKWRSEFKVIDKSKYDAKVYAEIQPINQVMMYLAIAMILLSIVLYITATNKRRNYYLSNYIATGICAGGDIIMAIVLMVLNGLSLAKYNNVDFEAFEKHMAEHPNLYFSESRAWFYVAFAVYAIVIVAAVFLILNMLWKMKLMKGEKQLLEGVAPSNPEEPAEAPLEETSQEVAQ